MRNVALKVGLMNADAYEQNARMYNSKVQQKRFEAWRVVITECVNLNGTASGFF
jgi:hypothetical protein